MLIANPIYDVVFNYLMEDLSIAKYLIGHIIDKNIIHLEPNPTVTSFKTENSLRVFRLDYAATIKTDDNKTYKVIIEIQKALIIEDILRFRRYLAKQYSSYIKEKIPDRRGSTEGKGVKYHKEEKNVTYPIISIYFLGDRLEHLTQPVINVKRHYYDAASNEEIHQEDNFIERLTHDSYIIQIPYLPKEKRTELEHILSIFDQHYVVDADEPRVLNLPDTEASDIWRALIRRLEQARLDEEFEELMRIEDNYYDLQHGLEKERAEREKERAEKEKERAEKEKERAEKEKERAEKERLIAILEKAGIKY